MNQVLPKLIAGLAIILTVMMGLASGLHAQNSEKQRVLMEARLSKDGPVLKDGVEWRIFSAGSGFDTSVDELAYSYGGSKAFDIPPGEYLVHAAYGHAGVVRKISVGNTASREEFTLNAGGLRLKATASGNAPLPARMLKFDIFEARFDENGDRKLLARSIKANEVIAFPVGTYHVVSHFGELNAEVRADLRVEPGKLTEASLQHRAALIRFRLVRNEGGDAIPDTAWSIIAENGEVIKESERTFPSMALAEGNYTAIARHNDNIYSEDFKVESGFNQTVEVKAIN